MPKQVRVDVDERRAEVKVKVVKETERLSAMPKHNFVPGSTPVCMTCGQIQLHPLHGIDADGLPEDLKVAAPAVGDPSYEKAYDGDGAMVALLPDSATMLGVEIQAGGDFPVEDQADWHLTLGFLPKAPEDMQGLSELVSAMAGVQGPLTGVWGGTARFNPSAGSDSKPVLVALPDLPELPEFHHFVVTALNTAGYETSKTHGYVPHMTIAYDDQGRVRAQGPATFDRLVVSSAKERFVFDLRRGDSADAERARLVEGALVPGEQAALSEADKAAVEAETERIKESAQTPEAKAVHTFKAAQWTHPNGHPRCRVCGQEESISPECNREPTAEESEAFDAKLAKEFASKLDVIDESLKRGSVTVTEREEPVAKEDEGPVTRAFLTEVGNKTLLTAPASTFVPTWEKALSPNQHMLWMQGRFVGAEKANRNGAFWSTADLEMGAPTVNYGPLNWLHEAKHVIGTIADSKLIIPGAEAAAEGGLTEPHIVAAAAVWKWIYPDEAFVMEEASDQGKLWYSMECVSREVACTGDNGCGKSYPYMDVMRASIDVCTHVKMKTSTRQFVDPTFLGGAVIVPPVRPGWADADAQVMREASALAERAFEDAGAPDMSTTEWEALMASVIGFARG